jgi:hypothetical protein
MTNKGKDRSDVHDGNIQRPSFDELDVEDRAEFEAYQAQLKDLWITRFSKTRQGVIIRNGDLPPIDIIERRPAPTVSSPVPDLSGNKSASDEDRLIERILARLGGHASPHAAPAAVSPSGDPSTSVSQPPYGMPMNFGDASTSTQQIYSVQPLATIPPMQGSQGSATNGQTLPLATIPTQPQPQPTIAPLPNAPGRVVVEPRILQRPAPVQAEQQDPVVQLRQDMERQFRDLGLALPNRTRVYQKPYPAHFDFYNYPNNWRFPEFVKFDGESPRTTWEHISQYLAQLGEAGRYDALRVRTFSLSLTGTAFAWYSSLPPNSIANWDQLECKFHEHFYSGNHEVGLADLASVRQSREESVLSYFKRFRDIKNRCFNLVISEKDLAGLAFNGLRSYLKEKLEGQHLLTLSHVQQLALAHENRSKMSKEIVKSSRRDVHAFDCDSDSSDDDAELEVCAAEWNWPAKSKPITCSALKPARKSRQDDMKFTFDVAKCDRIFDWLLQEKVIQLGPNHVIPSPDELKKRAYCKWHNVYSHATNDCNVFRRQVQSAINEGLLKWEENRMKVDHSPFPHNAEVNMVELEGKKVLVRPNQAETTKGKNVVIGEERPPKKLEIGSSSRNMQRRVPRRPKANFDLLLSKYSEGRAGLRRGENRNFRKPKPELPVSAGRTDRPDWRKRPRSLQLSDENHHRRGPGRSGEAPGPAFGPMPAEMWRAPPMLPFFPPWGGWCGPWMMPPPQFNQGWTGTVPMQQVGGPGASSSGQGGIWQTIDWKPWFPENRNFRSGEPELPVSPKQSSDLRKNGDSQLAGAGGSGLSVEQKMEHLKISEGPAEEESRESKAEKTETSAEEQNRKFRFSKSEVPVWRFSAKQRGFKTLAPGTAPLPQWCPSGLTSTQKRRLQRLRKKKLEEETAEKARDDHFNSFRPMQPPKQEWKPKRKAEDEPMPDQKEKTEELTESDDETDLLDSPLIKDGTPPPESMDVNVVCVLPAEFRAQDDEDEGSAQFHFGPQCAIFEKPDDTIRHLKPLYVQGHVNGKLITRMLVDSGAAVNLMPYSLYKKFGKDEDLMRTNLTLNGVGGNTMEPKGVATMELTIGSKTMATAFFVVEVQGNYNLILGRDWIHACRCIPSSLHQFLIQWVDDAVEIVHADASACVAYADASADWRYGSAQCISGRDLTGYDFLSITKDGFIPISVQPTPVSRLL